MRLLLSCNRMLFLKSISVTQFKNYGYQQFHFHQPVVAITGPNGIGKTNLLDAIYYLSFTKSYFPGSDTNHVQQGLDGFRISGELSFKDANTSITVILRESGKKEVTRDGIAYERFSEHIGKFPSVMIAPDDVELITGGSEIRRKFTDTLLSQLEPEYLRQLIAYNKVLQQRNSYLKQAANGNRNDSLLETLDEQLIFAGQTIYEFRKSFFPDFHQNVLDFYKIIAGIPEHISLMYESQLNSQPLQELLTKSREKDYLLQRTTCGIHKDDLLLELNGRPFKTTASQGQRKSMLFSLKLSELEQLHQKKGFSPFLLLDDVFEKLDEQRMHNLLKWVCDRKGSQVFITDPNKERIQHMLAGIQQNLQLIELSN